MRAGIVGLMGMALLLITAVAAHAHATLQTAVPAPGSQLAQTPPQIQLTFSEPISEGSAIQLFAANFQQIDGLVSQIDLQTATQLSAPLPPLVPGNYTVQWTAVAADQHSLSGSYTFQITNQPRLPISLRTLGWLAGAVLLIYAIVLRWRRNS